MGDSENHGWTSGNVYSAQYWFISRRFGRQAFSGGAGMANKREVPLLMPGAKPQHSGEGIDPAG